MKNKTVDCLPGIGGIAAANLKENGYKKARQVLGEFLRLEGDEKKFCSWLMGMSGVTSKCQQECFKALKEYCDVHV